ncbi:MAG TPA: histone deacetylase [Anaeromyxobacteraceae bacterium]|jgi:acetoin utilization deacetylase AcuC-like enzyme|nr:histone deacetylase [Anaeromyxobacteraceae bacterium]
MARVALFSHPACLLHDTGPGHSDSRFRLPALFAAVDGDAELPPFLDRRRPTPATEQDLLRAHAPAHVASVKGAVDEARRSGGLVWLDHYTPASAGSWEAALAAAGCAIAAAEAVLDGEAPTAFALARPPGHHATSDRAMGFCLFNNVAVAVRNLQARGRVERVLVLDWDAHHGNGTQEIFYGDPSVYVLSLHLADDYPGSGAPAERGDGAGRGTTRNVPLPRGTTAEEYRRRCAEALEAALAEFTPELIVVSAGFDLLAGDPEGGLALEPRDLHALTADLLERAGRAPVVGVLEGGYAVERIGAGLVNVLRAMAGAGAVDPG